MKKQRQVFEMLLKSSLNSVSLKLFKNVFNVIKNSLKHIYVLKLYIYV